MSYEKWIQRYKPITNTLAAGSSFDGTMFETYGPEYEFVKEQAKDNKVWTIRESDGSLQITAGLGWVNRLGYLVTEKPWVNQEVYIEID